jgi:hypothetical protein
LKLAERTVADAPLKMLFPSSPFIFVVEVGADVSIEKVLDGAHS